MNKSRRKLKNSTRSTIFSHNMIYFDNAATTCLDDDVLSAMLPYLKQNYGNPQSQHALGRGAAEGLISARDGVAEIFGCKSEEVYFLSGGTEAGNFAVKGVCAGRKGGHIIVSAIEHASVFESAMQMQKQGFEVTVVNPDSGGFISPEKIEKAVRKDTFLCLVMAANNELGTIQNYQQIGEICTRSGIFYYCDFVQAAGYAPFPTNCCSAFAISAHKFHGPKGAAAMFIKNGSCLTPLVVGGRQERGLRGGTVNVAGAVGLYAALKTASAGAHAKHIAELKNYFVGRVLGEIGCAVQNGGLPSVPTIANISFMGCEGANILFSLDLHGVCVSTGAACSAGAVTPSRTVTAAVGAERAKCAVRFSFSKYSSKSEADAALSALKQTIAQIGKN